MPTTKLVELHSVCLIRAQEGGYRDYIALCDKPRETPQRYSKKYILVLYAVFPNRRLQTSGWEA